MQKCVGVSQALRDLNDEFNDRRVALGDVAQAQRDAAAELRDEVIRDARQEYYDIRKVESDKYQEQFTEIYSQLRVDTGIIQDEFDESLSPASSRT